MDKKKLQRIGLITIIIVVILVIFFNISKPKEEIVPPKEISTEPVDLGIEQSISLTWKISEVNLPNEMNVWEIKNKEITDVFTTNMVNLFGFRNEPIINDNGILMFKNSLNNTALDINKKTNTIKFNRNLLLYPLEKQNKIINEKTIETDLISFISKNFAIDKNIKIETESISYEDVFGPRYITTDKNKAKIIHFKMNYKFDEYPVFSQNGQPINIRTSMDGTILTFYIDLPFEVIKKSETVKIKNFVEIKDNSLNKYRLFTVNGGRELETSSGEEKITESNITNVRSGYVYTPTQNEIRPYLFLEGNTILPFSGPVVTNIILSAETK